MWLRGLAVVLIAAMLLFAPMLAGSGAEARFGAAALTASSILVRSVAAQDDDNGNDNDDGDGDDNDNDGDRDDGDNGDDDEDGDNGDGDDDGDNGDDTDDDNDNDNDDDDDGNDNELLPGIESPGIEAPPSEVGPIVIATPTPIPPTPTATPFPTRTPTPVPEETTHDQLITHGGDQQLALTGDRVVLQVFGTMPAGIVLTLRLVDPGAHPPTPGQQAGDLIFVVEARDAAGRPLSALPAEAGLSVRYAESDVDGYDDGNVTLSRLDTTSNQWTPVSKLLRDPSANFVAGSIVEPGVHAVYLP